MNSTNEKKKLSKKKRTVPIKENVNSTQKKEKRKEKKRI